MLPDLLLAMLLFVTGWQRSSYIIGFLGWYDTYEHTKINYLLADLALVLGPLLWFYVRSLIKPDFQFRRHHIWHFIPMIFIIVFRFCIWVYDFNQEGYAEVQNGVLMQSLYLKYVLPFQDVLGVVSQLLYYAFTIQAFWQYRTRILQYFSNVYKVELNWIRNFLIAYVSLFIFQLCINIVNQQIMDLHWEQKWWKHILGAIVMLYVGGKGYFTDLTALFELTDEFTPRKKAAEKEHIKPYQNQLMELMKEQRPWLRPDLTLSELASQLKMSANQLSQVVNQGYGKNFNDFINEYRVQEVQRKLDRRS